MNLVRTQQNNLRPRLIHDAIFTDHVMRGRNGEYFFGKVQKIKKEVKNLRSTSTVFELDKVQEEFGNCCDELDELVTNKAKKFFRKYSDLFMAASRTNPEGIPNERQTENTTK